MDITFVDALILKWRREYKCAIGPWRLRPRRWLGTAAVEWKPQDLWIGAFWKRTEFESVEGIDLWICLIPCLPLHVWWYRRVNP